MLHDIFLPAPEDDISYTYCQETLILSWHRKISRKMCPRVQTYGWDTLLQCYFDTGTTTI